MMPPRFFAVFLAAALLATGCAAPPKDAPALRYLCQHGQRFVARLYEDAALLGGQSGQQQLARVQVDGGALSYSDGMLYAAFGLGSDGREASLRYAGIPQEVHCRRTDEGTEAVRATPRRVPDAAGQAASAAAASPRVTCLDWHRFPPL